MKRERTHSGGEANSSARQHQQWHCAQGKGRRKCKWSMNRAPRHCIPGQPVIVAAISDLLLWLPKLAALGEMYFEPFSKAALAWAIFVQAGAPYGVGLYSQN